MYYTSGTFAVPRIAAGVARVELSDLVECGNG